MNGYRYKDEIYVNALATQDDVAEWRMEGDGAVSFPLGRMRLEGKRDPAEGQAANIVFWCPQDLPDSISISWDFYPLHEPGLCILFFAARGRNGEDLFAPSLAVRSGPYDQYHHGDIDALHVSYFRRKHPTERAFTTCNLRKSYGFHLVAQGADPLPSVPDAQGPYRIEVVKDRRDVCFGIGMAGKPMLTLLRWRDDGVSGGPVAGSGKIGFRQMTPMIAEYANLAVRRIEKEQ
ncbi:MAG: DUF1961 family protein [Chitinivibrionales bacterium]|nr:DUF1961 family protein [Chitinivibrionales bacterium]